MCRPHVPDSTVRVVHLLFIWPVYLFDQQINEAGMRIQRFDSPVVVAPLLAAILASCGGARSTQYSPGPNADFRTAVNAEVRDAQDQVVLSGSFVESDSVDEDVERKAALKGTVADADAMGEAEVESCREAACRTQEVEFDVVNLQPAAVYRFVIDGKIFATVTTDERGRASVERDVPLPR
jgi:hypothetical protein